MGGGASCKVIGATFDNLITFIIRTVNSPKVTLKYEKKFFGPHDLGFHKRFFFLGTAGGGRVAFNYFCHSN